MAGDGGPGVGRGDEGGEYPVPRESPFALLGPREQRVWFAYMKLHLRLGYELNRQLQADNGISLADYDVLVALTSTPIGRLGMSALATRIGWERSRASHHARRMADRGLVTLAASAVDRRVTEVELTAAGWSTLADVAPAHVALVRRMFLDVLDPADMDALAGLLERVYDAVIEHGTLPRPVDHP